MKAIKGIFAPKYLLFSLFGAANFILGNLLFLILWYRFNSSFSYVQIAFPTTIFMFIISYLVQTKVTWKNKVYSKSPIRLMYTSSGGVYGTEANLGKHIPISENFTSPLGVNLTNYSKVKVHVEKYFYSKIPLSNFINPRLFTFYGDFLPLTRNFLIGNLMNSVLMKEEINLKSNGHTIRSYMHSAQMARSLVFLLYNSFSGVINVGSDVEIDVKSLAQLFSHLFGLNYELSPQPNYETYYVPNIDLLKNLAPNLVYSNFEERLLQWYSDLTSTDPKFFSF